MLRGSHWEGNCAQNNKREEIYPQKYPCNKPQSKARVLCRSPVQQAKHYSKIFHSQSCFLAISYFLLHFSGAFILSLLQILFFNNWQGEGARSSSFLRRACCSGCRELPSGRSLALGSLWFSSCNARRKRAKLKARINAAQIAALRASSELPHNCAFPWIGRQAMEIQKCFSLDKNTNQGCLFLPGIFTHRSSVGQRGISITWADVTHWLPVMTHLLPKVKPSWKTLSWSWVRIKGRSPERPRWLFTGVVGSLAPLTLSASSRETVSHLSQARRESYPSGEQSCIYNPLPGSPWSQKCCMWASSYKRKI